MKISNTVYDRNTTNSFESEKNGSMEESTETFFNSNFISGEKILFQQICHQPEDLDKNSKKIERLSYSNIQTKKSFCPSKANNIACKATKRLRTAKIKLSNEENSNMINIKNELLDFVKKKPKVFVCVFPFCDKSYASYYKWHTHHRIHVIFVI